MDVPLRLACLGDSWVSAWTECSSQELKRIVSPMPDALRAGLETRAYPVEFLVAGFPGSTTERLLDLVHICRLRDMELMSKRGCSIKGDLVRRLEQYEIPFLTAANESAHMQEDVDIVLVVVGSNDLLSKTMSQEILGRLYKLRQIYKERGVNMLLVSLGGVGPDEAGKPEWVDMEKNRLCINKRLLLQDWVLNFDYLMRDIDSSMWTDGWHLNDAGSRAYGDCLADVVLEHMQMTAVDQERRFSELQYLEGDVLRVSRSKDDAVSKVIAGVYIVEGVNHGRPVYKKQLVNGEGDVVIFFWDERNGPHYTGWWFGPEIGWDHPGWARNTAATEDSLPLTGWTVLPEEEGNEGLIVTCLKISELKHGACSSKKLPAAVHVGKCNSPLVSDVISGRFTMHGVNHGKPIYKKQGTSDRGDVLIFFWDTRTGPQWSGWWISPKVGSWTHTGWARHPDVLSSTPPVEGWYIPPYENVDTLFKLTFSDDSASPSSETICAAEESETSPNEVRVTDCDDSEVAKAIEGTYFASGKNHGKPIYRKSKDDETAKDVHLFFWDARGGSKYAGWWISSACGDWSHPGWAHNDGVGIRGAPPQAGWRVPQKDGVGIIPPQKLDNTMQVTVCQSSHDINQAVEGANNASPVPLPTQQGSSHEVHEPPHKSRKRSCDSLPT